MQLVRKEVRGILSLGTLLRLSAVSGFAIGVMFGVFSGLVNYQMHGGLVDLMLIVLIAPPVTALFLTLVTLIGHPLYVVLGRARFPGLDKIAYDVSVE